MYEYLETKYLRNFPNFLKNVIMQEYMKSCRVHTYSDRCGRESVLFLHLKKYFKYLFFLFRLFKNNGWQFRFFLFPKHLLYSPKKKAFSRWKKLVFLSSSKVTYERFRHVILPLQPSLLCSSLFLSPTSNQIPALFRGAESITQRSYKEQICVRSRKEDQKRKGRRIEREGMCHVRSSVLGCARDLVILSLSLVNYITRTE